MIHITGMLVLLAPVAILLYDWIAKSIGGSDATITKVIQKWSYAYPELPAVFAGLMVWLWMHLFINGLIARMKDHLPPD